ncbi:MAG: hypothetical protein IAG13_21075 [Deltaproteobacteria bacterium]|nr:hypothetical protein [Nannocystaceae bacterium]
MVTQVEPEPHSDEVEALDPAALLAVASELIVEQARSNPLRTLGIAFGVGYVLGGGVPRFLVRMAINAGMRSASAGLLASGALTQLASQFGVGGSERATPSEPKNGHAKQKPSARRPR